MSNWLTELVNQHKDFESPLSFWRWAGLAAISAVVKDNIWIDRAGLFKQYPNIYVILYADSGLKKGAPIAMAKSLVSQVNNTKVINGRSSIQAIMKEISTSETQPGGKIINGATAFIAASELSAAIVEDPAAFNLLTDLYDRSWNEHKYTSLLKQEKFSLAKPTISLLAGINEAHAEVLFSNKDIKGGFLGRTFVIHESKRNRINSLIKRGESPPNYNRLAEHLRELSKLRGEFENLDETRAGEIFNNWYIEFTTAIEQQRVADPTGTLNRFSESVIKVAMLLSLAEEAKLVISESAMLEAIKLCETLVGNVRKTTMGAGKSQWATHKALVIKELLLRDNHMISREQFMKKFWMHANSAEWDDIIRSLVEGGHVAIENQGNRVIFIMPDKAVDEWSKHFAGKN
ncbi:MAG: hypothetical protein WBG19_02065 [Thermoplasmata archaeon]